MYVLDIEGRKIAETKQRETLTRQYRPESVISYDSLLCST